MKKRTHIRTLFVLVISVLMILSLAGCTDKTPQDGPSTDGPSTDGPSTDGPSTDSPSTDGPSTDGPSTDGPSTDGPSTDDPSTDDPSTDGPSTDDPSTDDPSTDDPTEEEEMVFNLNTITKVTTIGGGQDGAIYNNYLFSFGSYGECAVYSMNDYTRVGGFTLDKADIIAPHSNSVFFGTTYYDQDDEYPLLYSNIYNNQVNGQQLPGTVNVYRLTQEGDTFSTTLVQVIKIAFTSDSEKWASGVRPYGNFVLDTDNNDLWAFVMDDVTRTTKFYSFELPALNSGVYNEAYGCELVSLEYEDIQAEFSTAYFNYLQGCCYHNGRIYSSEGFTNDLTNVPTIRVINLENRTLEKTVKLPYKHNINVEPEFLYVHNNKLYYKDVAGNLYYFEEGVYSPEDDNENEYLALSSLFDIDHSKCRDGVALQTAGGAFMSGYPNMWITDFLRVDEGTKFTVNFKPYKIAFYHMSEDGTVRFVSCLTYANVSEMTEFTAPAGANCVVLQFLQANNSDYPAAAVLPFRLCSLVTCREVEE